jgi:hypothetical protein
MVTQYKGVRMKKIIVAMVISVFAVSAFACDGSNKEKPKDGKPKTDGRILN